MNAKPSKAIKRFGTEQNVEPATQLQAGSLSAAFDQGALRYIKFNEQEAIRNIAFVVRDKDWGTVNPSLENINIKQETNGFTITFDATCTLGEQVFTYTASISGHVDTGLVFYCEGQTETDFVTNRAGFVVLHAINGVSGRPVQVEHIDGEIETSVFPDLIDPVQPFKNIRALTHDVYPGQKVTCRMLGDTFEMEDQRQWNDASYKTYVRPIALPWPYTLEKGNALVQSIELTFEPHTANGISENTAHCSIIVDDMIVGKMPQIGLGLDPQHLKASLQHLGLLEQLSPQLLTHWHDLNAGHGLVELQNAATIAKSINAHLTLEAPLPCLDFLQEIETIAKLAQQANVTFSAVHFSPAAYLKSITPGTSWPDVPALSDIYKAAKKSFPNALIGGGMLAYFPELNRLRPPTEDLDFISHCSNTITHAGDDLTVTENLETLPHIIKTCRSFANGKPYRVGPSSIAMRFNPYGSKTMDNPDSQRIAMARMDPRQRGLMNAAWTIGYAAHLLRGDIDAITLHAPIGEFGLIYHKMPWSQPWFDDNPAQVYPAFFAVQALAKAAGLDRLSASSSKSHDVECFAYQTAGEIHLWICNLSERDQIITLQGLAEKNATIRSLDETTFEAATTDLLLEQTPLLGREIKLAAYATSYICASQQ